MIVIGPHISISKGFAKAAKTAVDIGANTFQFFSRNPRGGNAKVFDEKDIEKFQNIRTEYNFGPLLAHAPYTMNLGGSKDDVYEFGRKVIKEDIERMDSLDSFYKKVPVGGKYSDLVTAYGTLIYYLAENMAQSFLTQIR